MDGAAATERPAAAADAKVACDGSPPLGTPIARQLFTADPSAHVFDGRLYVYPSHDLEHNPPANNQGDHFAMKDYHVLSFDSATCRFVDHGEALNVANVPWARKEMWAPDAAYKNGGYFLYFPAKDEHGVFRIGVATSATATGPFAARPTPITGSYSIDPAVFVDDDGQAYLYFGGLWGGQLEHWQTGSFQENAAAIGGDQAALGPRFAKLGGDMLSFDGPVEELSIVDAAGKPLRASDNQRRFFEGVWLHKYHGTYYLSYSTGDSHYLVYATAATPSGPFTYRGRLLNPVKGWTTHHSIVEFNGKWYLFYHDDSLSGEDNKRCVKVMELTHAADGSLPTLDP